LATAGGLLSHDALPGVGGNLITVSLILGSALLLIFLPLMLRRRLNRWPRRLRRPIGRALVALRRLARNPRSAAKTLCLSLTIQGSFVLLNAWLGWQLGIRVPLTVWFLVWPLAKIAGLMPISLGGLAVREALDLAEQERRALALGKAAQRRLDREPERMVALARGERGGRVGLGQRPLGAAAPAPELVVAGVDEDPVEPGRDARSGAERPRGAGDERGLARAIED